MRLLWNVSAPAALILREEQRLKVLEMNQQQVQQSAQQVKQSLDAITQAGTDQNKIRQAVNEAKTKLDQLIHQTQQQ
jgi:hypothetical protein